MRPQAVSDWLPVTTLAGGSLPAGALAAPEGTELEAMDGASDGEVLAVGLSAMQPPKMTTRASRQAGRDRGCIARSLDRTGRSAGQPYLPNEP